MDGDDNMTDDFFSMEFKSIGELIKRLDMFDEKQSTAVINAMHKAGDMIEAEQKRLAPDYTRDSIKQSKVYATKKGSIGVTVGYQAGSFQKDENGFAPGMVGTVMEYGRPGQSPGHTSPTMTQVRNGKEVEVSKGTIQPQPHIRRGFDNVREKAVETVIDTIMQELDKAFNG